MPKRIDLDAPARPSTSRLSLREWQSLCKAYKNRCAYCGTRPDVLCIEHNLPQQRGGTDTVENILPACRTCNNQKGDLTPLEWLVVQAGLALRNTKPPRGLRPIREHPLPERRRDHYYPRQRIVAVEGDWEVLECGHRRHGQPIKPSAPNCLDTGFSEFRFCYDCGRPWANICGTRVSA